MERYLFFMKPKLFIATKAFIIYNNKVLVIRESSQYTDGTQMGKYGEVGGRLTPGEKWDDSLHQKIKKKTNLTITISKPFYVGEWRRTVKGEDWQIVGVFFECFTQTDQVQLSNDHDEYVWINPQDYKNYPIMEATIPAFVAYLKK
jgi:8-oxo-dGTP diphosphatase